MSALDQIFRQLSTPVPPRTEVDPLARVAPEVLLPPDVVIQAGAFVPAGVTLEAGCRIGPNAVFVEGAAVTLRRGVQVGANATVLPGVTLAAHCVVRPGAVVTRSVPPAAIVEGNPASIVGYVDTAPGPAGAERAAAAPATGVQALGPRGVTLHHFPVIPDLRGNLTVGEFERDVPFVPQRWFMVFGVPSREVRGEHAHHECHQFLVCVRGSCAVVADDGRQRVEVVLDAPHRGLYLPPMTWGIQYKYAPDAVLLVFASHAYDAADYIRDHDAYLAEVARQDAAAAAAGAP